ncbi:MAG: hypothetical protein HXY44_09700 [Syntrophaceae bacterium]|nr:hypothetical protein [Syntrophaceae bacterium]
MLKEDFIIQSHLRKMLIRSNINYSKMDFGTVKGVVYLRGLFQVASHPAVGEEEQEREYVVRTLYVFEKKIKSLPGVTDVIFQFLNWRKDKGQWVPVEIEKKEKEDEKKRGSDVSANFE